MPDFIPHSGVVSMDNPEYILQEARQRRDGSGSGSGNYHTLGIPVVPSPTSSLPAPPYTSLSSTNSSNYAPAPSMAAPVPGAGAGATIPSNPPPSQSGLNGAMFPKPRSSDGESDEHEYYNDVDRLKRELQPLQQPPRNETTV